MNNITKHALLCDDLECIAFLAEKCGGFVTWDDREYLGNSYSDLKHFIQDALEELSDVK